MPDFERPSVVTIDASLVFVGAIFVMGASTAAPQDPTQWAQTNINWNRITIMNVQTGICTQPPTLGTITTKEQQRKNPQRIV